MTDIKGFNVSGQKITPNTYGIHEREKYTGSITGLEASQNSTPDMNVLIQAGTAVLTKNTNSSVVAVLDTPTTITIATADTSNPRIDTIVVYEDLSVTMPTEEPYSIDAVGRFKIVSVAGTPATSPSAPNDATIQSAIGGTNTSWARICTVRVEANTTTIIDSKIDNSVKSLLSSILAPSAVGTNQIANGAVTKSKLSTANGEMGAAWAAYTPASSGFSSTTVNIGRFLQVGKTMYLHLHLAGTSNSGYVGITLPAAPLRANYYLIRVMDNGVNLDQPGMIEFNAGSTSAVAYIKPTGGTFTSSGTKTVHPITIVYELA